MPSRDPGDAIPAELVLEYRKRHGLTQDQLAQRLGVAGKAVVSGWETGRTKCEGPAAEFLLHLAGRGNAAIEIPAFTKEANEVWSRAGNFITAWRETVAVPEGEVVLEPRVFATLFPEAALPGDQVEHRFPFTAEGLPGNVCGVTPSGWVGSIPSEQSHQPSYLWMFKRDGRFLYREKLWEDNPTSLTRGNFDLGSLAALALQTTHFLQRLSNRLNLDERLGFTLQLGVSGARGHGVAVANPALVFFDRYPTSAWADDHAEASQTTTVGELLTRPVEVGVRLVSELVIQVSVELADAELIEKTVRATAATSRAVGFLKAKTGK